MFSVLADCFIAMFKVLPHIKWSVGWLRLKNHHDCMTETEKWEQSQDCPLATGMAECATIFLIHSSRWPLVCLRLWNIAPVSVSSPANPEESHYRNWIQSRSTEKVSPFLSLKLNYGRGERTVKSLFFKQKECIPCFKHVVCTERRNLFKKCYGISLRWSQWCY
jgi:hypothetical protein